MSKPNNAAAPGDATKQKSEKKDHQEPKKDNVVSLPGMCLSQGCKQKSEKANFCMEHFDWFKEGLITKEGKKPVDFEKKLFHYQRRRKVA